MMNMKSAVGLAKHAINHRIIAITHGYQTDISKVSYLTTTDTKIPFQLADAWQTA